MTTNRIVKTATEFAFTRQGETWTLSNPVSADWKDCLPTMQFLVQGDSGQLYRVGVSDKRDEVFFKLDEDQPLSIGYDFNTFTIFLDVDETGFLEDKENFFRVKEIKEENR